MIIISQNGQKSPTISSIINSWCDCQSAQAYFLYMEWLLPLGLAVIFGVVVGQAVQDEDLSPLCALVEGRQQLVDVLGVQVQQVTVRVRLADLRQRRHGVGYNLEDGRKQCTKSVRSPGFIMSLFRGTNNQQMQSNTVCSVGVQCDKNNLDRHTDR